MLQPVYSGFTTKLSGSYVHREQEVFQWSSMEFTLYLGMSGINRNGNKLHNTLYTFKCSWCVLKWLLK